MEQKMSLISLFGIALYVPLFLFEVFWYKKKGKEYNWTETKASAGVYVGVIISRLTLGSALLIAGSWVQQYQVAHIAMDQPWHWLALFIGVEFAYYWFHRGAHEIRWVWASHSVHHSGNFMNFPTALRLAWTSIVSFAWVVYMPLIWLGFDANYVFGMLMANLLFQYILHTEMIPKLSKPLEWLFNTPSNHRVHHGSNPAYLDRNHGGVTMIFDHLFGTYSEEQEDDPVRYGLVEPATDVNPVKIAFKEWRAMFKDVKANPRHVIGYTLGVPGWSHDGSRLTSAMIRSQVQQEPEDRPETITAAKISCRA